MCEPNRSQSRSLHTDIVVSIRLCIYTRVLVHMHAFVCILYICIFRYISHVNSCSRAGALANEPLNYLDIISSLLYLCLYKQFG